MFAVADNFFAQFGLPVDYEIDADRLNGRFRDLQAQAHPDRFAAAGEAQRLRAVQLSSYLNEAYETLKSPLRRAGYLLSLRGVDVERVAQSDLSPELLLQQMSLREQLAELPSDDSAFESIDKLNRAAGAGSEDCRRQFAAALAADSLDAARRAFHALQFWHKFQAEIAKAEDALL